MAESRGLSPVVSAAVAVLVVCGFVSAGSHLRYLSFSARPSWPQATAELDAIVASAAGVKTSDFRVAKSESTIFIAEVGFRPAGAPITTAAMDRAMAEHGWKGGGLMSGRDRFYCKGDLVGTVSMSSTDMSRYLARVEWGNADTLCGRR